MYTKIYWLYQVDSTAKLGIMARPRGGDWLEDEIEYLKKQNVGLLVSLLEREEINELKLQQEEALCKAAGIGFINFPIADRGIPKDNDNTDQLINNLAVKLNEGTSIVIHCRMGIGRSSIIAASILLHTGEGTDSILHNISEIRGLKVPDTEKQVIWLKGREWNKFI